MLARGIFRSTFLRRSAPLQRALFSERSTDQSKQASKGSGSHRKEGEDQPLGYVFVSETYHVTWRVPEEEAQEFV